MLDFRPLLKEMNEIHAGSKYDRALDVHISHLRRKIEHGHELIRTIRGAGYMFTAEPGANA